MKTPIIVTSIISGTVLLIAPFIYRALGTFAAAIVLSHTDRSFTLEGGVQYWYDVACMIVGVLLIAIGLADALGLLPSRRP